MNRIKLNLFEPYKAKIEIEDEFDQSIFINVYRKAKFILENEIVGNQNKIEKEFEYNNNIIAFTGDRGSGKTSTMLSFVDSLDKNRYEKLQVFEPANTEKNADILEVFIAKIFLNFKKEMSKIKEIDRRELIELFEKLYKNLRIFNENKEKFYENEDINNLIDTADSIEMKKTLAETVDKYLSLKGPKKQLLLIIDDFDLNFEKQYDILEKIRKYLIIPNLVILVCFKKDQMIKSIIDKLSKDEEAGTKYFEKVFPADRIIEMPKDISLNLLENETLKNILGKDENELSIRDAYFNIFKIKVLKTELSETEKRLIFPETIRNIINQLIFLRNLSEEKRDSGENLINFIEQLSLNDSMLEKIKNLNSISKRKLLKTNWIEEVDKLDEVIESDEKLEVRKNTLLEKLYLLNYLNKNLDDFSYCVSSKFSFLDISEMNSSFFKKKFDLKLNKEIFEYIEAWLKENKEEKYLKLFENKEFTINNIFRFLEVDYSKLNFENYSRFLKNIEKNQIKVKICEDFKNIIEDIISRLRDEEIDFSYSEKLIFDKKLEVYLKLMLFLNEKLVKKINYINKENLVELLKFFSKVPKLIENLKILGLEYSLDEFNKIILVIENFFSAVKLKLGDLKSSIRKIKKIQENLEVKIDEIKFETEKIENIIKQNENKIKANSKRINELKKKSVEIQNEFEKEEATATLKSNILNIIRRNDDIIQLLESEKHNLQMSNINLNLDMDLLNIEKISDFYIEIAEQFEDVLENILKQLGIDEVEFQYSDEIFFKDWIKILES